MSCILHIETSTSACSVALSQDGEVVFKKEDLNALQHNIVLGVYVDEALSMADSHAMPLDAVAVSCDRAHTQVCASEYPWPKEYVMGTT